LIVTNKERIKSKHGCFEKKKLCFPFKKIKKAQIFHSEKFGLSILYFKK